MKKEAATCKRIQLREKERGKENASQCNGKEKENDRGNFDFVFCIRSLVIYRVDIYVDAQRASTKPSPKGDTMTMMAMTMTMKTTAKNRNIIHKLLLLLLVLGVFEREKKL